MSDLFPLDVPGLVLQTLTGDVRPLDGLLHSSSHLTTPLRHVQLEMSGAEQTPLTINELITFETGNLWHRLLRNMILDTGAPFMSEVKLNEWMPPGWGGTADWILWSSEHRAFVLGDLKTVKGAGLPFIIRDGAKNAHLWQLSSYWYALRNMGLPLMEGFAVCYLPKDGTLGIEMVECKMIDEGRITDLMTSRKNDVDLYLAGMSDLAPIPEREEKRIWNAKAKTLDVVLKPHWSAAFCRFVDCGCNEEGQTKIGHWILKEDEMQYIPRKDFERPADLIVPQRREFKV